MSDETPEGPIYAFAGFTLVVGILIAVAAVLRHVWIEYGLFWVGVALIVVAFFFAGLAEIIETQSGNAIEEVEREIEQGGE